MDRNELFRGGLIVLTLLVLYLSYIVAKPFLITIILALIITFIFHPIYKRLATLVKSEALASTLMIVLILLILIIPSAFMVGTLVSESASTYRAFLDYDVVLEDIPFVGGYLSQSELIAQGGDVLNDVVQGARDYIFQEAPSVLREIVSFIIHLFIFFFIMFFANTQGPAWYHTVKDTLPLRKEVKKQLFLDLENVTSAVVYGQFLTAVVQGTLGGLLFFIFGVPNPVFWGFVMIILSILPLVGASFILIPAGLIELLQGDYIAGIGVLVFGLTIVVNIDQFIRPYFVNKFTPVHPIIILIGVFGGLQAFGFAGLILGPLILALFLTLLKDFSSHKGFFLKE